MLDILLEIGVTVTIQVQIYLNNYFMRPEFKDIFTI